MSTLIERLRAGEASEYYPAQRQAGLELLIADTESAWLDKQDFIDTCIDDDGDVAHIDWIAVKKELDTVPFKLGGNEIAYIVLEWAAFIANEDNWNYLDNQRAKLIVEATNRAFSLNPAD
ncbi:hypothetical protein ABGB18_16505 [Nonomuraea sp. B12E4]|uniref:hypothetical protein n=1 Tax=Nonomuraea sp. B12E4 TaxID=3153564 RepID=UPI00325E518D